MAVSTSLRPIDSKTFDYAKARHLLNRAGFGGTPKQIAALREMGLDKAVDYLVDYDKIDASDLAKAEYDRDLLKVDEQMRRQQMEARRNDNKELQDKLREEFLKRQQEDRVQMRKIEQWWLARMVATPRPLEEKLTLLWHGHFASNHRTVHNSAQMFWQNEMFRKHAAGNFGDLAYGIVRDPAMIRFLNNDANRKEKPNENLARELMELFTLGEGNYTEDDIKNGARALTGYMLEDQEFEFRRNAHDGGRKTILGQTGDFNGEDFVRIILTRPECPVWVSYKLYKHFVGDIEGKENVDPAAKAVIQQMAKVLLDNKYAIRPVLKAVFKSEHFYDPLVVGNQIKSPAQVIVGSIRVLGTPTRDLGVLADAMGMMGQKLFDPPSVAGWEGGRGWINTSTLYVRQNFATFALTGKLPFNDGWSREKMNYDPMVMIESLIEAKTEPVIDLLTSTLLAVPTPKARRDQLLAFMAERQAGVTKDSLIALLMLITAMPEYQLC